MGERILMSESEIKDLILTGAKHLIREFEEIEEGGRSLNDEEMKIDLGEALYEYEKYEPGLSDAEWAEDLPYEVPVRAFYKYEEEVPDTYDTPGLAERFDYDHFEFENDEFLRSLEPEQAEIVKDAIDMYLYRNFDEYMSDRSHRNRYGY